MLSVNLIETERVGYKLNQTAVRSCRYDLVRLHPEVAPLELEDLINLTHKLHRKLLLPHVIVSFDHYAEQAPRF